MLGPTGNFKAVWKRRSEFDCITNFVSPKSTVGSDDHGVIFPYFDILERNHLRILFFPLIHGNEFIENPIIQQQQELLRIRLILNPKESF